MGRKSRIDQITKHIGNTHTQEERRSGQCPTLRRKNNNKHPFRSKVDIPRPDAGGGNFLTPAASGKEEEGTRKEQGKCLGRTRKKGKSFLSSRIIFAEVT